MIEPQAIDRLHKLVGVAWIKLHWFLFGSNFFENLFSLTSLPKSEYEALVFRLESLDDVIDHLTDARAEIVAIPLNENHQWLLDIALDLKRLVSDLLNIDTSLDYTDPSQFDALNLKIMDMYFTHFELFLLAQDKLEILTGSEGLTDWAAAITELADQKAKTLSPAISSCDSKAKVPLISSDQIEKVGWRTDTNDIVVRLHACGQKIDKRFSNKFVSKKHKQVELLKLVFLNQGNVFLEEILAELYLNECKDIENLDRADVDCENLDVGKRKAKLEEVCNRVKALTNAINSKLGAKLLTFTENSQDYTKAVISISVPIIDLHDSRDAYQSKLPSGFRKSYAERLLKEAEETRLAEIDAILGAED